MVVSKVAEESIYKMYQIGYEVLVHNKNGNSKITIANYPTHSKELIEMFVDRIVAIWLLFRHYDPQNDIDYGSGEGST